ncbi:hypothetical protein JHK86_013279 [Glycine max]|nr:hypothetical protein JHK86_013279 [Glycine max]
MGDRGGPAPSPYTCTMNGFQEEIEHVLVRTITKVKHRISEREDGAMCDPAMQAGLSSVLIPIAPSLLSQERLTKSPVKHGLTERVEWIQGLMWMEDGEGWIKEEGRMAKVREFPL